LVARKENEDKAVLKALRNVARYDPERAKQKKEKCKVQTLAPRIARVDATNTIYC